MVHGVRYVRQDITYLKKEHKCPICNTPLNVIKASAVINSNSEEAKGITPIVPKVVIGTRGIKFRNYNAIGNIKWIWKEFECPNCNRRFTVDQMKQIEAAPNEQRADMVASFDELRDQTDEEAVGAESTDSVEKDSKKSTKRTLRIVIPSVAVTIVLIVAIILLCFAGPRYVDTNGPDNFELNEILLSDIIRTDSKYSSSKKIENHSGNQSDIGKNLRDCDYDYVNYSFGKLNGICILQATKAPKHNITFNIRSTVESGNAEIVILVDGRYYCSVDANTRKTVTVKDTYRKEVLVKIAGEDATNVDISVTRIYD